MKRRARPAVSVCPKTSGFSGRGTAICAPGPPLINITIKKRAGVPERPVPWVESRGHSPQDAKQKGAVGSVAAGLIAFSRTPRDNRKNNESNFRSPLKIPPLFTIKTHGDSRNSGASYVE